MFWRIFSGNRKKYRFSERKHRKLSFLISLVLPVAFIFSAGISFCDVKTGVLLPDSVSVIINEIMFNPDGDENAREYVEILNLSQADISLEGWEIGDGEGFDGIINGQGGSFVLPAGSYGIIIDPDYFQCGDPYPEIPEDTVIFTVDDSAIGSRGLSNSVEETVYLVSAAGDTLSAVTYSIDNPAGCSWERINPSGPDSRDNFGSSAETGGSPGKVNSISVPDSPENEAEIIMDPNPFLKEVKIVCRLPFTYARVNLYVYDRKGRLSAKLRNGEDTGAEFITLWDGKKGGNRLSAGPYILSLEAMDRNTGRVVKTRKTLVIAANL